MTFGSRNKFRKVTVDVLSAWTEILKAVANSRINILVDAGECYKLQVLEEFERRGVSRDRVQVVGSQDLENYLKSFHAIDLHLDTFPMGGGVTTCQSLWMGVPVLAWEGGAESSRMSSMILQRAELGEFVARSREEYIQKAVDFSNKREWLAELRMSMRSRLPDRSVEFARGFEQAYRQMLSESTYRPKGLACELEGHLAASCGDDL